MIIQDALACLKLHYYFILHLYKIKCVTYGIVWRNVSILGPKLVLAYAEDVLSDFRLKNCATCKSG